MRIRSFHRGLTLVIVLLVLSACGAPYEFRGRIIDPPAPAPELTLTDQRGQPFRLSEQRGTVVVLFFGFTSCPDVCPTTLADLATVRRRLGGDAASIQVVLVTVDPERDSAAKLSEYVALFDPTFLGLRGSTSELATVYKDFGVFVARTELPNSALGYTMDHPTNISIIDRAGNWRLMFSTGDAVDAIADDLRYLAQEQIE